MSLCHTRRSFSPFFAISLGMIAVCQAAAIVPLRPGEAVVTCFSDNHPNSPVIGIYDTRDPVLAGAPLGVNNVPWTNPQRQNWTLAQLQNNEIFGIALDDAPQPNIFVTSTAIYKSTFAGVPVAQTAPGTGKVFKINGASGVVSVCATLPQGSPGGGQGLGNATFDAQNRQLLVTNFYDGKIWRIDPATCTIKGAYDPFSPFGSYANTAGGFAPRGERIWGVGTFRQRLVFARWRRDLVAGSPSTAQNEIWSVALDAFGVPFGPALLEVTVPGTMPVADIEFAPNGRMLLAQRSMDTTSVGDPRSHAHQSDLLEYRGGSGAWVPFHTFALGEPSLVPRSSAGGADYVCPVGRTGALVAGTGDALIYPTTSLPGNPQVYGFQLMPATGGSKNNGYLVDLDGLTTAHDKTQIGDVDVYHECDRHCSELKTIRVLCANDGSGDFIVQFQVKNLSSATVFHAFLVGLPNGVTSTPNYFNLGANGLASGATSGVFQTTIHGAQSGQQLTFQITLHDQELEECCSTRHTITLPKCGCAQVISDHVPTCNANGTFNYSFTLQSLFPQTPAFVVLLPTSPANATLSPNVISFGSNPTNVSLTIGNAVSGQQVCFLASLHTEDFDRCCSIRQCVVLPACCGGDPSNC